MSYDSEKLSDLELAAVILDIGRGGDRRDFYVWSKALARRVQHNARNVPRDVDALRERVRLMERALREASAVIDDLVGSHDRAERVANGCLKLSLGNDPGDVFDE